MPSIVNLFFFVSCLRQLVSFTMLFMLVHLLVKLFSICFSGFLLSLSAPGFDLWFFAWVGLSPLFIIINTSRKLKEVIIYSFLFGFTYNLSYLHWIFSLHPLTWLGFNEIESILLSFLALLGTVLYSSFFYVIFSVVIFGFKFLSFGKFNKNILEITLTSLLWLVVFNKISTLKVIYGFPWTLIEYSQYRNIFLIQIAEYVGTSGISFLIVFFNIVFANILLWIFSIERIGDRLVPKRVGELGSIIKSFLFISILIFLTVSCGAILFKKNQVDFTKTSPSICVLQGNLPIKATRGGHLDINLAKQSYISLLEKNNASLIIIPEGALPTVFNFDLESQSWLKGIAHEKQSDIIAGSICRRTKSKKLINCAAYASPSSKNFLFYEKERLVPFGEFTPFSKVMPDFLKKLISSSLGSGFIEGKNQKLINTTTGEVGINICFELIFPAVIRRHTIGGANFLINLSDLSWFSSDILKQQFLSFGVFRAIENRKPLIIAANNGISAFIEKSGRIKSQSIPKIEGVLLSTITPNKKITFYAKYGW